jgi:hypothetical protein
MVACQLLLYGVTGTLTHMPPEVLEHGVTSKAADVYSFGVLLWQVGAGGLQDTAWGVAGHCLGGCRTLPGGGGGVAALCVCRHDPLALAVFSACHADTCVAAS